MLNFLINFFINCFKFLFYSNIVSFNENKLKKSNTKINLIDNNYKYEHKDIFLKIDDKPNKYLNNYICLVCKKNINNEHHLIFDKHFCSINCREKIISSKL